MNTIEIDFQVFKELTMRRESEEITYNDVIRNLLGLAPIEVENKTVNSEYGVPWEVKGVTFPHGTEFRSTYKGRTYYGKVENGVLVVNGKSFSYPSKAAISITKNSVNGWIFWECRFPGQSSWKSISKLRS